jgi:queuine tRNA-ribosyltransferase
MPFGFRLECTSGGARAGTIDTDHGAVRTPVFMPVGTQATVKAITTEKLADPVGAQIILGNAYHLILRPGVELIEAAGGLHRFMDWPKPILTDSGGYQVYSLADLRKIGDDGITFRSHIDGALHLFTPGNVVEAQRRIGADILMSFDYCAPFPCERGEAERAVALTTRWAVEGAQRFGTRFAGRGYEQVLFGIVQGSCFPDLRRRSAAELLDIDFPGYAIGGLSVGEAKDQMWDITALVTEALPADKPRYLMGVGTPLDLLDGVARGVDMFDCVMPTRNARNGTVFTRWGKMVLKNAQFARDFSPIDEQCGCETCRRHSRAYLRHLFAAGEVLGPVLATHHSLYFYCELMAKMREAIEADQFDSWRREFVERYTSGERGFAG